MQRASNSVESSAIQPVAEQSQTQPDETAESSSSQAVDSRTPERASAPSTNRDIPLSTTTPASQQGPDLIQRIPSLMTAAFNVIGTIITNSLSDPSASEPSTPSTSTHSPTSQIQRSPKVAVDRPTQQPDSSTPEPLPASANSTAPIQPTNLPTAGSNVPIAGEVSLDGTSNTSEQIEGSGQRASDISEPEVETIDPVSPGSPERPPDISRAQPSETTYTQPLGEVETQSPEIAETRRDINRSPSVESSQVSTDVSTQVGQTSPIPGEANRIQTSDRQKLETQPTEPHSRSDTGAPQELSIQAKSSTPLNSHQTGTAQTPLSISEERATEARDSVREQGNSFSGHEQPKINDINKAVAAPTSPEISLEETTKSNPIQTRSHPEAGSPVSPPNSGVNPNSQQPVDASSHPSTTAKFQSPVIQSKGNDATVAQISTSTSERSLSPASQQSSANNSLSSEPSKSHLSTPEGSTKPPTNSERSSEHGFNRLTPLQQDAGQSPHIQPQSISAISPSNPESTTSKTSNSGNDSSSETPQPIAKTPLSTAPPLQRHTDIETGNTTSSAAENFHPQTANVENPPAKTADSASKRPTTNFSSDEEKLTRKLDEHIAQLEGPPADAATSIQRAVPPQPNDNPEHVRVESESSSSPHRSDTSPPSAAVEPGARFDAPSAQLSGKSDGPIIATTDRQQETTIHRQESIGNSAGTEANEAVSLSNDSHQFPPPRSLSR